MAGTDLDHAPVDGTAPEAERPWVLDADPDRPRLRGVVHRWAAPAMAGVFVALAVTAADAAARAWVGVYGVCVTLMLAVSAVYHSGRISPRVHRVLKRVDHATILLAIAGSYTGIAGFALDGPTRTRLLVVVWVLAAIGVAVRMLWLDAPYPVVAAVYVGVGWVAVFQAGAFLDALDGAQLALVVAGGLLYSVGAVVYALHRPNPWPATFGYHEIFHTLVVVAAVLHVVAVGTMIPLA